jgi:hypothetical protein
MGYSTEFNGELKFTNELTAPQLEKVKSFCGEYCGDHHEWAFSDGLTWMDIELTDDFSGVRWNGSEETYDLVKKINMLTYNMKKEYPDFGLVGKLFAQGEEFDDRWMLAIVNGLAVKKNNAIKDQKVTWPHCENEFILEDAEQ